MDLDDRLYSSTEVSEILGVSLRSVYRYLDDGDLVADIKTATGRHRFTRRNILDFLYPQKEYVHKATSADTSKKMSAIGGDALETGVNTASKEEAASSIVKPKLVVDTTGVTKTPIPGVGAGAASDRNATLSIDWLARFRAAQEARLKDTKIGSLQPQGVAPSPIPVPQKPLAGPLLGGMTDSDTLGPQAASIADQGVAEAPTIGGGFSQQDYQDYDDAGTLPNDQPLSGAPPVKPSQIDWLAKFKAAREQLYKDQQGMPASPPARTSGTSVGMETKTVSYQSTPVSAPAVSVDPVVAFPSTSVTSAPSETSAQPVTPVTPATPVAKVTSVADVPPQLAQVATQPTSDIGSFYYTSGLQGLKELAHTLHKSAATSLIPYGFTMYAGMSLYKSIKPFSVLHVYVKPDHRTFFEKVLRLTPCDKASAQLCLIASEDNVIFDTLKEMHGLKVVSTIRLKKDLYEVGEEKLAAELDLLL